MVCNKSHRDTATQTGVNRRECTIARTAMTGAVADDGVVLARISFEGLLLFLLL